MAGAKTNPGRLFAVTAKSRLSNQDTIISRKFVFQKNVSVVASVNTIVRSTPRMQRTVRYAPTAGRIGVKTNPIIIVKNNLAISQVMILQSDTPHLLRPAT